MKISRFLPLCCAVALSAFGESVVAQPAKTNVKALTPAQGAPLGGGTLGLSWYEPHQYVNVAKACDTFKALNEDREVKTDANGYPTEDFKTLVVLLTKQNRGTYKLSAQCAQNPTIRLSPWVKGIANQKWDEATKTVTADAIIDRDDDNWDYFNVEIFFENTNGGARNLKLMQPGYALDAKQVFTTPNLEILKHGNCVRAMDLTATNHNPVKTWAERNTPDSARYTNGRGAPWEDVVALANAVNRDIWINTPARADDEYVRNLALLLRYGSDGSKPYTSAQANPRFAPLKPNLRVWIEHSNEVWNGLFAQLQQSIDEGTGYMKSNAKPALNMKGEDLSGGYIGLRWHAKRVKDLSDTFAQVFGSSSINARVRPIYGTFFVNGFGEGDTSLRWMEEAYGAGTVKKSIYGLATAPYFGAGGEFYRALRERSNVTKDEWLSQWTNGAQDSGRDGYTRRQLAFWTSVATFYGIKHVAYEGGLGIADDIRGMSANTSSTIIAAQNDPQMASIVETYLQNWYRAGGEQFEWFVLSPGHTGTYSITDDSKTEASQRLLGFDRVRLNSKPVPSIGHLVPGEIDAREDTGPLRQLRLGTAGLFANAGQTFDYLLRAPKAGSYSLTIAFAPTIGGNQGKNLDVSVNNSSMQRVFPLGVSPTDYWDWQDAQTHLSAPLTVKLNAGLNTVRLVYASNRGFMLDSLRVTPVNGKIANARPSLNTQGFDLTPTVENGAKVEVSFTVYDPETPLNALQVTATSDNLALLPASAITVALKTDEPRRRTVTMTPVAGQHGVANVTFSVRDGDSLTRSAEFRLTVKPPNSEGDNLARSKNTLASGTLDPSKQAPSMATDGNATTLWQCPPADGHWLWVDLGKITNIKRARLLWGDQPPSEFKLQVSDPSDKHPMEGDPNFFYVAPEWKDLQNGAIVNNTQTTVDLPNLSGVKGRFVRVFFSKNGAKPVTLREFEVYGE